MPYTNPQAEQAVFNKDATVILKGCAIVPQAGVTTRAANVGHPTAADDWFIAVANMDIDPDTLGTAFQQPMSNVQVRLASNVARGDKLNIANTIGEFQKAPAMALNAKFVALSAGVAGSDTTWAAPL